MDLPYGGGEKPQVPRSPRRRVVLNGTLETLSARISVALKNLSCTGAMVEGESVPDHGRDVILKTAGLELFATIVWSDGHRCGLHFDEPLSPAQVLELHRITPAAVQSAELQAAAEWFQTQGRYANI